MKDTSPHATDASLPVGSLRDWAMDRGLRLFIRAALFLPYRWRVPLMGKFAAYVVAPLAGYPKRIRENLEKALPDLPEAEVRRLCRAVPDNVGRTLIEIYSGAEFATHVQGSKIGGPGLAALEAARAGQRPVVLVTGHFGNYDAARAVLIGQGYDMGALYRPMSNRYFNAHYVEAITAIGQPMFEQGKRGLIEMVRHLKSGGVLGILTDLHAPGGARTTFFGRVAKTSTVTADLALKFDAVLIPVYAVRQPNGLDFEIVLQAPVPATDAFTMTQAVNDGLEDLVRAHMAQWFWIHRRWKAKARASKG